jgi:membrane-associated HD superfamily phosphohydrolase
MNQKSKRKFRLKTHIFVPTLFILAIALVTLLFPRQGDFRYSFSEGKPWQYGLLTAPFDFPIYKPVEQLKAERDSILRFYEPYYTIDEEVEKNAIAEFDADVNLNTKLSNLPPDYILYLRNGLQKIYRSGIMRSDDYDKIFASETQSLRLKKGNLAESKSVEMFSTIKSAYEQLLDNTPKGMDVELIRMADINRYLRENIVYDASTSEKAREEFIQQVSPSSGMVQAGERIIDQGEIVNAQTYKVLNSLKRVTEERSGRTGKNGWMIFGQLILVLLQFGAFYAFLLFFRPNEFHNRKNATFMMLVITTFVALTAITCQLNLFNVYIIPFCHLRVDQCLHQISDALFAVFGQTS